MNWLDEIELELNRGRDAERSGNNGKVRTAARRAAGRALTEYQERIGEHRYGNDFLSQLKAMAGDAGVPCDVRDAAMRLQARITQEFTSPSENPLSDALAIISYIQQRLSL